jgi:hypothetical protein
MDEHLKYPIGHFIPPGTYSPEVLDGYIRTISEFPAKIAAETAHLTDAQLDTTYRQNGWTIRQVVNHCADSHMNALARFKFALTENTPVIKPYLEALWGTLPDSKTMPIQPALSMIEGIHQRWTVLMNSFSEKEWQKAFIHPEKGKEIKLNESAGNYAWHCEHHLAHITGLKGRVNWN